MDSYRIPTKSGVSEYVDKRSRFLGLVQPVGSEDEARAEVERLLASGTPGSEIRVLMGEAVRDQREVPVGSFAGEAGAVGDRDHRRGPIAALLDQLAGRSQQPLARGCDNFLTHPLNVDGPASPNGSSRSLTAVRKPASAARRANA